MSRIWNSKQKRYVDANWIICEFKNISVEKKKRFRLYRYANPGLSIAEDTYREKVSDPMLRLGDALIKVDGIESFKLKNQPSWIICVGMPAEEALFEYFLWLLRHQIEVVKWFFSVDFDSQTHEGLIRQFLYMVIAELL